jgi:hypothetical protein
MIKRLNQKTARLVEKEDMEQEMFERPFKHLDEFYYMIIVVQC